MALHYYWMFKCLIYVLTIWLIMYQNKVANVKFYVLEVSLCILCQILLKKVIF